MDVNELGSLISEAMRLQGLSQRQVADQAQARGYTLTHPTVGRWIKGQSQTEPDEATLKAFSEVLTIPISQLRRAANVPTGAPGPYKPPAEADRLSLRQRQAVNELIRAIVTVEGSGTRGEAAPIADLETARSRRTSDPSGRPTPIKKIAKRSPRSKGDDVGE